MTPDNQDLAAKLGKIIVATAIVIVFFNLGRALKP